MRTGTYLPVDFPNDEEYIAEEPFFLRGSRLPMPGKANRTFDVLALHFFGFRVYQELVLSVRTGQPAGSVVQRGNHGSWRDEKPSEGSFPSSISDTTSLRL